MDFLAVHIFLNDPVQTDLLVAQLSEMAFTGFEERDDRLVACIPVSEPFYKDGFEALMSGQKLTFEIQTIPATNWNAAWEHSFSPVIIDKFCGIRAAFHSPVDEVKYEIIITPRMTFGTGHHATTASMIRLMEDLDLKGKSVLDFGTGTGILAILAAKMGAARVVAVDNDPAAVVNAGENASENAVAGRITFAEGDKADAVQGSFDCILVNIQLQVILQNLERLLEQLHSGGFVLLGGVLEVNYPYLKEAFERYPVEIITKINTQGWIALMLKKQEVHSPPLKER